jgi:PTS system nitrogen regulatory IIA component
MDIKDLLSPQAVFELRATSKAHVLRELARRAELILNIDPETIARALARREALGSTGLGEGIALPHARMADLAGPFGIFALLRPAVEFDAIDERPVDLVFALLLPDRFPQGQLKPMACVARRLRDPALSASLRASRGEAALYELLTGS